MFAYNKFLVAIAGFALTAITGVTGFDFAIIGLTPEALVGALTAFLVWLVPNLEN